MTHQQSFNGRYGCLFDERDQEKLENNIRDLVENISGLKDETKGLKEEIRTTGKWLIAALIIIALGRTGIELLQEYTGKHARAQTEGTP